MEIDFASLPSDRRYKLLVSSLVPRPIALISTMSRTGQGNIAPFSFFNAVCDDPPAVAVGVNCNVPGRTKDTAQNIRDTGEFIVNLVDEALASKMNQCGASFPPEIDEFDAVGLTPQAGKRVRVPRIAEAPISFECVRMLNIELSVGRNVVIGEVVYLHVRDDLIDANSLHVHAEQAGLIARMHGGGWYARTTDLFNMPRV